MSKVQPGYDFTELGCSGSTVGAYEELMEDKSTVAVDERENLGRAQQFGIYYYSITLHY
jgi:hypothetical protein